ncbi:FAD/NAD(P)-binding protein [Streptosporangium saharense]|uniref:Putative NAD(P)/FAD-binding protein YdhS n=1 Tax=Streptosporangium saharense TaxID=1706840 RepID=A0A7W7QH74_9ACTN|nr:FAD/NAD(P)-binding protein [Streptosporangium saharense]MBB4913464.1 putative NAD(P)/FAD-binding protein YdhS [Streptosporangium saharense]
MSGSPSVAIVGGGASGTLAAVHLLRLARARAMPLEIMLIDQYGRHAQGQAYSTVDPRHLLNASVDKMSGLDDDPGHLLRWAHDDGIDIDGSGYLPRQAYGRYLRDLLTAAEDRPARVVRRVTATATALVQGPDVRVQLSGGGQVGADAIVLALGNRPQAPWPRVVDAGSRRYVADPWAPGALARIRDGAPVLVVGTGLTMVDVALTVTSAHPGTVVHALSRHALLPRPHPCPVPPPIPTAIPEGPLDLAELLRAVRLAVRENGGDWHAVIDGLRPRTQRLWANLSRDDQRRFLDLVARYWEVHRHRIPPATAARIGELRANGRLRVIRGRLVRATTGPEGVSARVSADGAVRRLDVGWLVNATGPGGGVAGDPFLSRLVADGVVRQDTLRLGIDADPCGRVLDAVGRPNDRVFTLGPTLRGTLYETTAIAEIRAQAAALASRLADALALAAHPR